MTIKVTGKITDGDTAAIIGLGEMQIFPRQIFDIQRRAVECFSRACAMYAKLAQDMWSYRAEFITEESDEISRAVASANLGANGAMVVKIVLDNYHRHSDRLISHVRRMSDLARDVNWQILTLREEALQEAFKPLSMPFRSDKT